MKLTNFVCTGLAVAVGITGWSYAKPLISQNGTSVIAPVQTDNKSGGKALAIKVDDLSQRQQKILSFAYDVALQDGIKEPKYLQGIVMQESKAGAMRDYRVAGMTNAADDRYFGLTQVKMVAAKAVMARYPEMWKHLESRTDEELKARLILDDEFNVRVGSKYYKMLGGDEKAMVAYNKGQAGAIGVDVASNSYAIGVKKHAERVKNVHSAKQEPEKQVQIASIQSVK